MPGGESWSRLRLGEKRTDRHGERIPKGNENLERRQLLAAFDLPDVRIIKTAAHPGSQLLLGKSAFGSQLFQCTSDIALQPPPL